MTRTIFNILTLIFTFTSCFGQTETHKNNACDVKLQFELNRNSSIQFYDSTGTKTRFWENDTLDFIYTYFHSNTSVGSLIQIDSIIILNGGNQNNTNGWELDFEKDNEIVELLNGNWIKLSDCIIELSEWMLYGNYKDHLTPYIFEKPDTNSTKTQFDPRDGWSKHKVKILEVKGTWFYVELLMNNEKKIGWMPSYNLCAHPHTTCN